MRARRAAAQWPWAATAISGTDTAEHHTQPLPPATISFAPAPAVRELLSGVQQLAASNMEQMAEAPYARGRPTRRQRRALHRCLLWSGALLLALAALTALGALAGGRARHRGSPHRPQDELLIRAQPARGDTVRAQRLLDQALPGAGGSGGSAHARAGVAGGLGSSPAADGSGSAAGGAAGTAALADTAANVMGRDAGLASLGRAAEADGRCGELRVPKVRFPHTSLWAPDTIARIEAVDLPGLPRYLVHGMADTAACRRKEGLRTIPRSHSCLLFFVRQAQPVSAHGL